MRIEALKLIACPVCKQPLGLKNATEETEGHVMSGELHCHDCAHTYPIIGGVPRLLPPDIAPQDIATGEAYSKYYAKVTPGGVTGDDKLYGKTVDEEIDDFCAKTGLDDLHQLEGKVFLDAGCGLARIEGALSKHCQDILAFDVSPSVEQAFQAWRNLPNVHIVQGDLTSAPILPERFDFVWCDGALPYVSDVEMAVRGLLAARSPTGFLYSWCYGPQVKLSHRLGRIFHATRLPMKIRFLLIYATCWGIRAAVSIRRRENMLGNVHLFAQGVLDASLAGQINHVSEAQLMAWFKASGLNDNVPILIISRGKNLDFRVGVIG